MWCYIVFAINTGLRPNELRQLKWKNIEFETEERWSESKQEKQTRYIAHVTVPAPIAKTRESRDVPSAGGGGNRLVKWLDFQREYCEKHNLRVPGPGDYIFCNPYKDNIVEPDIYGLNGQHQFREYWKRMMKPIRAHLKGHRRSDKPYNLYSLRTTFIERQLLREVDSWLIARAVGHANTATLMKWYEKLSVRDRSKDITSIEYGKPKEERTIQSVEDFLEDWLDE